MRTLILAAVLAAPAPALALDNLNVEQPERLTTQSGQASSGPIATSPLSNGSADIVYGAPPVVEGPFVGGPVLDPGPAGTVVVPAR